MPFLYCMNVNLVDSKGKEQENLHRCNCCCWLVVLLPRWLVGSLACWLVGHQALSALDTAVPLQHILPDQQVGKASNDVFLIYY